MKVRDRVKRSMRQWTLSMTREDLEERLRSTREPTEYGVDSFGFSVDTLLDSMAPVVWLYQHYFRVETKGLEKVPRGRVLLISNHSGQLPLDAAMIGIAMLTEADPPRITRAMIEKWVPTLPIISTFYARVGQVVGTPQNCRRLLEHEEAILVFPEGVRGISKLFRERYQLQEFGLGFMRLALETNTPIVPVAVIGAEEQAPAFANVKPLAKVLGFPAFPITPTLLPFPLPSKYRITFGEPISFHGRPDDDDVELEKRVLVVKAAIQSMLEQGLKARKAVFW